MGLGFNDGFKPVSDEPLIHLPIVFWDIPAMRKEALAVKESAYCWKTEDYTVSGCPVGDNTPQLSQTYYDFIELYGDCGEVSVSYLYIDKDSDYMWHTDNEISKRTGHTKKDVNWGLLGVAIVSLVQRRFAYPRSLINFESFRRSSSRARNYFSNT